MNVPTAIRIGQPFGEARPEVAAPPAPAEVPVLPEHLTKAPEVDEAWLATPSIEGQAQKYPQTIKVTGVVTEVFNLIEAAQLEKYNALQGLATLRSPTILVVKDLPQFSEKSGHWIVFFQYRNILFRKLAPDKAEKNP
jgi:hypothetical protein